MTPLFSEKEDHAMNIARPLRIIGAIALLIGGLVHLQLYFEGYRSIDKIGPSFLLNAIASGVVAAALACRREWLVKLAGIGVAAGTIGAFIISRQGEGLFDFREHGLHPSPQAIIALVVEIVAIIVLVAALLPSIADRDESSPVRLLSLSTATSAIVLVGLGAYWAGHYDTAVKTTDGGVTIVDFAFAPPSITITKGTTVVWTNSDNLDHSIVAKDNSFGSDHIAPGATFKFTFNTDGTFSYNCGIHPSMSGTITVTG
jgi:plastocyanin